MVTDTHERFEVLEMTFLVAAGIGLLIAGLVFVLTGRRASEGLSGRQAIVTVAQIGLHIAVAVGFGVLLASIDSTFATVAVVALVALGIGWAVIRALRGPSTGRAILVLAATLGLSMVMMAVFGMISGGDAQQAALAAPIETTSDPAGDCECDPEFDLLAVGTDPTGTVWATVGGEIQSGATYWLWLASDPYTPIEITRAAGSWKVAISTRSSLSAKDVVTDETTEALHLEFHPAVGAFAVTSAQGDRAPDTGYVGDSGSAARDLISEQYQHAYADLSAGHRQLGGALMRAILRTGTFSYAIGVSADPDVVRTASLTVGADAVEFHVDATSDRGGHTDRFARTSDDVCLDDDVEPCVGVWMNPFDAVDNLLSAAASIDVGFLESREVLGEEAVCVAITDVGDSTLHVGEFCGLGDGTIAFVDDRTAGVVIVLTER
ncbi:MAG: hypothetical protein DRJ28_02685 [Actinobacteria bacterium]|nr:MAG: hypothetical protein DRJ28_02685 [Actinomycetota bacterium]